MKKYENPSLTVETFETSDVITASLKYVRTLPAANPAMNAEYDDLWENA